MESVRQWVEFLRAEYAAAQIVAEQAMHQRMQALEVETAADRRAGKLRDALDALEKLLPEHIDLEVPL